MLGQDGSFDVNLFHCTNQALVTDIADLSDAQVNDRRTLQLSSSGSVGLTASSTIGKEMDKRFLAFGGEPQKIH